MISVDSRAAPRYAETPTFDDRIEHNKLLGVAHWEAVCACLDWCGTGGFEERLKGYYVTFFIVGNVFELIVESCRETGAGKFIDGPFGESFLVEDIFKVLKL